MAGAKSVARPLSLMNALARFVRRASAAILLVDSLSSCDCRGIVSRNPSNAREPSLKESGSPRVSSHLGSLAAAILFAIPCLNTRNTALAESIASGPTHYCAVTNALGVQCWGANESGELGNGTTTNSSTPVTVTGFNGGVSAISTGSGYICVLSVSGGVECWGENSSGQLGNGSQTNSGSPVFVSGLTTGVSAIAAGATAACALTSAGAVECWGDNTYGELGNGTTTSSTTPVSVSGLSSGVTAIAAGASFACALKSTGAVVCWGQNVVGNLGNGNTTNSSTPVAVVGLASGVTAITTGAVHACAIAAGGSVMCWGYNFDGQLGNGTATIYSSTPVAVTGLSGAALAVLAGGYHTCATTNGGLVECWGFNADGQLGNGTTANSNIPVTVPFSGGGANPVVLSAGGFHTCAINSAGYAACWGDNANGQLGNGSTTNSSTPVAVSGPLNQFVTIAAGDLFSCGLAAAGTTVCWGANSDGQLGNGTTADSAIPVQVNAFTGSVAAVTAGVRFSCALTIGGAVMCWGQNDNTLGNGGFSNSSTPVPVTGLSSGVVAIAAGDYHVCAVTATGAVVCWGSNEDGELGNGTNTDSGTPVQVTGLAASVAVAAGNGHSCAVTIAGAAFCWGNNSSGQLGNGTTTNSNTPVGVTGLSAGTIGSSILSIATGYSHSCAVTVSGTVECWGNNSNGQLGNGTYTNSSAPVLVNLLQVREVAALQSSTCAVTNSGTVSCWGDDTYGELGNAMYSYTQGPPLVDCGQYPLCTYTYDTPVAATGLSTGVIGIANGRGTQSGAITSTGTIYEWGNQTYNGPLNNLYWSPPIAVAQVSANTVGIQGVIRQKYRVLGVYYAPPGAKSTVTYGQNYATGTNSTYMQSSTASTVTQSSISEGFTAKIFGDSLGGNNQQQQSQTWTTQVGSSNSVTTSSSQAEGYVIPGPSLSSLGVDHSEDVIWLWLNPSLSLSLFAPGATPVTLNALNFDSRDPVGDLDIVLLTVGQLETLVQGGALPANIQARLSRSWSTTGAINGTDAVQILGADPFVQNSGFNPSTDTSGRFDQLNIPPINYAPTDGENEQPVGTTYSASYSMTTAQGQNATNMYSTGIDDVVGTNVGIGTGSGGGSGSSGTPSFNATLSNTLKVTNTTGITDQWSSQVQQTQTQTGAFVIYQPLLSDGYSGPTAITVWKDNVYGSFMFYPVQEPQSISFSSISNQQYSPNAFPINATSNSGLPVSFTSETSSVCSVSGSSVTMLMPGVCTIAANQSGNALYLPAAQVAQSFSVLIDSQTITFSSIATQPVTEGSFTLAATDSSGLPVSYSSSTTSVCAVSGSTITLLTVGTCSITANQAGNVDYSAASPVSDTFAVEFGQIISFATIGAQSLPSQPLALSATSSSGLPVTFSAQPTSVCTVSGSTLTLVASGLCSVSAAQAGNATYAPAITQIQMFSVSGSGGSGGGEGGGGADETSDGPIPLWALGTLGIGLVGIASRRSKKAA
jgi:alpha-tubulin suppressor-like RCC1 family protein